ncbi:methyl-accepting chemotaxis protein [Photobacterium swingsii]|uniref:methyl-accepting chemotaxis protein n=1 Tax=Photobacterium swingsii TaxID=680026 RepID=UPI004067E780
MFKSIKTRIAVSAGLAMVFTLSIAMAFTTYSFSNVQHQITTQVSEQLTQATKDNLLATAKEQSNTLNSQLAPVLANLDQLRAMLELSSTANASADLLVEQFIAGLKTQDESVFAGYMVWENKVWSDATTPNGIASINEQGYLSPFFSPTPSGGFEPTAMASFRNQALNNNGERIDEWHLAPFESGQTFVMEPYYYDVRGNKELITTISQPLKVKGKIVGSLGFDWSLAEFQGQSEQLASKLFQGQGDVMITSWEGNIMAHSKKPSDVGRKVSGETLQQWANIQSLASTKRNELLTIGNEMVAVSSVNTTGNPWVVIVSIPSEILTKDVTNFTNWSETQSEQAISKGILAGVFAAIAGIIAMFVLANRIGNTMGELVERMRDIAEGEGDLTRRIQISSQDETGQLAQWFNTFLTRMQDTLRHATTTAENVDSNASSGRIKAEEAKDKLMTQLNEVNSLATAINEMSATAQEVANSAVQAATAANQVQTSSQDGIAKMDYAATSVTQLAERIHNAQDQIQSLAASSAAIQSILSEIGGIADQTNLLALNAAIEAARAGEYGRGFAVVADEVRNLANRTQKSTEEIQGMLARLEDETQSIVTLMVESQQQASDTREETQAAQIALEEINAAINVINDMNNQIASAAEEQSSVTEEVNRNVVIINETATDAMDSMNDSADITVRLAESATDLRKELNNFRT